MPDLRNALARAGSREEGEDSEPQALLRVQLKLREQQAGAMQSVPKGWMGGGPYQRKKKDGQERHLIRRRGEKGEKISPTILKVNRSPSTLGLGLVGGGQKRNDNHVP